MRIAVYTFLLAIFTITNRPSMSQTPITERYRHNQTPTYAEVIACFREADSLSEYMQLQEEGLTDVGIPLHVLVIDADRDFDPVKARARGKNILFINNGIHPGEPDGIDACIRWISELLGTTDMQEALGNTVICMIPVYNIDGALNRNSTSRVNQDGPESFGFRGNAQNYDLNRDFIKADSRNALSFARAFRKWDPDVFIDTHVSNGADYQYVMTLIPTQHNKLTAPLGNYLKETMLPALFDRMETAGFPMCPYVNEIDRIPDNGIQGFLDRPRYSTGFTALYNTIGFMPETHMLKPYAQRVESTLAFLKVVHTYVREHGNHITTERTKAQTATRELRSLALDWELDTTRKESFLFRGYAAKYKTSEVSGLERLYYDRNEPFTKPIPFLDHYTPALTLDAPAAYIVPQAWRRVIENLEANGVIMETVQADTMMQVNAYYITGMQTALQPYEGHYYHSEVTVRTEQQQILVLKGDRIIQMNQAANQYLMYALEPQSPDGFYAWGLFDAILMQKEWFSDYVFEDLAAEILQNNPALRAQLEAKKAADTEFAADAWSQLHFVYEHSGYKERSHMRYPVYRIER